MVRSGLSNLADAAFRRSCPELVQSIEAWLETIAAANDAANNSTRVRVSLLVRLSSLRLHFCDAYHTKWNTTQQLFSFATLSPIVVYV